VGSIAQIIKHLLSKYKALDSVPKRDSEKKKEGRSKIRKRGKYT
jgi:hypothetical protein